MCQASKNVTGRGLLESKEFTLAQKPVLQSQIFSHFFFLQFLRFGVLEDRSKNFDYNCNHFTNVFEIRHREGGKTDSFWIKKLFKLKACSH